MRSLLFAALLAACSSSPKPAPVAAAPTPPADQPAAPSAPATPAAAPTVKIAAGDTPWADSDGNTFIVPDGWKVATLDAMTVITAPEGDSHIAFVDASAPASEAALATGWKAYKPDAKWPMIAQTDAPDRDGWAKGKNYEYQTSPNEKRAVQGATLFANGRWLVVLVDFANATAEKRGGQLSKIFSHLYPKGFSRESFKGKTAAKLDAAKIDALKKFVSDAEAVTGVPGVSFGVIQDGKVVYAGGIGVRELGKKEPVDAKTLYMIASNTKTLTTLMLAKLVDQKKLAWDAPVISILPTFKLGSDEVTKQVLVKHLICACTGMPRQDLEWLLQWKGSTPETVMTMLGTMMPTSKFGELFQYSNLMAAAGGYTGGHAAFPKLELGAAYDKAMQTLVFDPLGMTATTFDYARGLKGNHAAPHGLDVDGKISSGRIEMDYAVMPVRPAGAAWSTVNDMLKYVAMELAKGKLPNGKTYIAEEPLRAREAPQVAIGKTATYGMGLMVDSTYGVTVVHHGGDVFGYHSDVIWLPDQDVGAVILTNGDGGSAIRDQFRRKLLEVLFDGNPEADAAIAASGKALGESIDVERKLLTIPADPAAAAKLAARYTNPALGTIIVTRKDGKTWFEIGALKSEMASKANPDSSISFVTLVPGFVGFDFVVNGDNLVVRDAQHEYVYTPAK